MELTAPQSELFVSDAKATAMVSGFGAGKTCAAITRMLATKFNYPTVNLLYTAPTYPLIRDILYPEISIELESNGFREGKDFAINENKHNIYIQGAGHIKCRTMDNPANLVGFQVGDAFVDEFDVMTKEKAKNAWRKILARARSPFPDGKLNQLYVTTTPEGFNETYRLFVKERKENYRLIKASTYSNPHLPDDYIDTLLDMYPEELVRAYIMGEFVNLTSGSVYYAYDRKLCNTHYVAKPREAIHVGMDFNVYHMAAIIHIMRDGHLYAVDEIIDARDTPDVIDLIKNRYEGHPTIIYPDASGKNKSSKSSTLSDHKLLKEAGFRIRAKSANPLIKDRVTSQNASLQSGKYWVNVEKCPVYSECLEQQVYDKNGAPLKDGIIDNPIDAGGYCNYWHFPVNKKVMRERILGGL